MKIKIKNQLKKVNLEKKKVFMKNLLKKKLIMKNLLQKVEL